MTSRNTQQCLLRLSSYLIPIIWLILTITYCGHLMHYESSNQIKSNTWFHSLQNNHKDRILSAVNTLRCLTTPGCYPKVPCSNRKESPAKLPVKSTWEEHSFCVHDLNLSAHLIANNSSDSENDDPPCIVYSFGLYNSIDWESKMANAFHCQVFAFDPTSTLFNSTPAVGVKFYKLGLQGVGADVSSTKAAQYDVIDPLSLRTLGQIVKMLGHQGKQIDVLRLDCEY